MKKSEQVWFVYLLQCENGRLYTGITVNLATRFRAHLSGKGARFTRSNKPSHILAARQCRGRSEASKLEYEIKRLTVERKRALARAWPILKDLPKKDVTDQR